MFDCLETLKKNQDLIISSIAHSYETGVLEEPEYAMMFTNILALLCEGKVEGGFDNHNTAAGPMWKLTPEYEEELRLRQEALAAENVIVGPW